MKNPYKAWISNYECSPDKIISEHNSKYNTLTKLMEMTEYSDNIELKYMG